VRALELKLPPPAATLLFGAAMWAVARNTAALPIATATRTTIAALLAGFGLVLGALGNLAFRPARTTTNPI
jgi:hypothetical protein